MWRPDDPIKRRKLKRIIESIERLKKKFGENWQEESLRKIKKDGRIYFEDGKYFVTYRFRCPFCRSSMEAPEYWNERYLIELRLSTMNKEERSWIWSCRRCGRTFNLRNRSVPEEEFSENGWARCLSTRHVTGD